jgi:hypothetical protein
MIFVPSVITLAVTLLRLIGELNGWSETFFNRAPGGPLAIVGIIWLAFVFAIYFAVKLQNQGESPASSGRALGLAFGALVVTFGSGFLMFGGGLGISLRFLGGFVLMVAGLWLMRLAWPVYWNVMMAYALAARIPVIIVMYFAISGNWNTHYDVAGPEFTFSGTMAKFLYIGVLPQLFAWVPFTVAFAGLFGVITAAIRRRRVAASAAA